MSKAGDYVRGSAIGRFFAEIASAMQAFKEQISYVEENEIVDESVGKEFDRVYNSLEKRQDELPDKLKDTKITDPKVIEKLNGAIEEANKKKPRQREKGGIIREKGEK